QHTATGSSRAKTVKLADLIDNLQDICKHDMRFAQTFLVEMGATLEILDAGNQHLYQRAWKVYHRCQEKLRVHGEQPAEFSDETAGLHRLGTNNPHLFKLFTEAFSAQDISEPVRSFDALRSSAEILAVMEVHDLEFVCLRRLGVICGYAKREDLHGKLCGDHIRSFRPGQTISADSSLVDVIHILTLQRYGFITILGEVAGYFSRNDINKPVVRMWLFGIITFIEMEVLKIIIEYFPDDSWKSAITDKRLELASKLQQERERRGQQSTLLDCLQFSDKAKILISKQETLEEIGLGSRSSAKKVIKEIESLRNNLSHAQDIVTYDWAQIVRITHRLQESF
ncbi:MAG: bifunctional (p)ppGpp synthetase/guanosine-3',5'-bis(diphosphate) 3'-pyrophosphohydrolase, partial [Gammaproteobacteria bacterium]|nr:bifunctional (p)ppGpp synthetase/guanosine-3',5'-bis(diphosphate) 3'-pyrophosphohydrolase [Gammaproteobacteria bacterium]